jgi:hypothetical protein
VVLACELFVKVLELRDRLFDSSELFITHHTPRPASVSLTGENTHREREREGCYKNAA